MELLLGCGNDRRKKITINNVMKAEWDELVTLDIDPECKPDVVHDLNVCPYPFADNTFDEIHAYEVLEHCGRQGDFRFFFRQFEEFWRILRPGGLFVASVPCWDSEWAWGDPGHTRVITPGSLVFLTQANYDKEVGVTAMTDYRSIYRADFELLAINEKGDTFAFVLKAIK